MKKLIVAGFLGGLCLSAGSVLYLKWSGHAALSPDQSLNKPAALGEGGPGFEKFLDSTRAIYARLVSLLPSRKPRQVVLSSGKTKQVIAEITVDPEFIGDLKMWHAAVRSASGNDPDLIERARTLKLRATKAATDDVLEEDPMNGEFMIRMMKAWAAKQPTEARSEAVEKFIRQDRDLSLISDAIDDFREHGVLIDDGDEEGVDLDEGGFIDDDLFAAAMEQDADEDEGEDDAHLPTAGVDDGNNFVGSGRR